MRNDRNATTETLEVTISRVKSTGESFSVFQGFIEGEMFSSLTVKMFTGPCQPGQRWTACGAWQEDPKWGRQFCVQFATLATPRTFDELAAFITSGLVHGWTWRQLGQVQDAFGADACAVIDTQPHRLAAEAGITDEQLESLTDMWERGRGLAPLYAQLTDWGIPGPLCDRLIKQYRFSTVEVIAKDPYTPIAEVAYYTWKVAEQVAGHLGIVGDDPRRITAGVAEVIRSGALEHGHTWMTRDAALDGAMWLLDLDAGRIEEILAAVETGMDNAEDSAVLVRLGEHVYPGVLWCAEGLIAASIARRLDRGPLVDPARVEALTPDANLSAEQWSAVAMALTNTVSLLTGGPGCGKTTTIRAAANAARLLGLDVTLMAPTGKAAQRMKEATGHEASTIHRKLKITPGRLRVATPGEPLTGLVVIDEISMLDTITAAALLGGISPDAHILLVGDPDQLPSVGPGAVLRDLLAADVCTRVHLTRVFRNDAGIAINAAHIRAGEYIESLPDCRLIQAPKPEDAQQFVVNLLHSELPRMGYTAEDTLVLCPTNDGESGRHALNTRLQALFNGARSGQGIVQRIGEGKECELREGDRVIVTKNNSELGVFNGDVGTISAVRQPKTLVAEIDGRPVTFGGQDRNLLQLAYAITGHKSQGSEAPVVIAPIFSSRVLSREWLYTVLTRARKQVYLLGDPAAIQGCIRTVRISERRTGLVSRLAEMVSRTAPASRPHAAFAYAPGSPVFHTRRQAIPWRTSCGLDSRDWRAVPGGAVRPCLRCSAASGATLAPFPADDVVAEAV